MGTMYLLKLVKSLVGVDVPPKVAAGAEVPIESLDGVGVPPEIAT